MMRLPIRSLIVTAAVLLAAVQTSSAARRPHAAQAQRPWCLEYHAGGTSCAFADFEGCMYTAAAYGGNCTLSPSWRAKYGDRLPPHRQWVYGGNVVKCF